MKFFSLYVVTLQTLPTRPYLLTIKWKKKKKKILSMIKNSVGISELQNYNMSWKVHMIICAADNFFDQWYPSTATPMEEVCGPQGALHWKLNLTWLHSMIAYWSTNELFKRTHIYFFVGIYIYIYIECLNINGTYVTANNSTINNVMLFFNFRYENSILLQLLILDHNALD